jgi:hypothetical protein
MSKPNVLFLPASIRSHIMPAMYLADILKEKYESYFTVTNDILEELVIKNDYKTIRHSGVKSMIGMENDFILNEKKEKIGFWNLVKTLINNEIFEFRKKELISIIEQINPKIVFIDIFSSTDYLVLKAINPNLKLFFFNPMLSTYRINGYPIVSEGTWMKNNTKGVELKKSSNSVIQGLINPKSTIINHLYKKHSTKVVYQKKTLIKKMPLQKCFEVYLS